MLKQQQQKNQLPLMSAQNFFFPPRMRQSCELDINSSGDLNLHFFFPTNNVLTPAFGPC